MKIKVILANGSMTDLTEVKIVLINRRGRWQNKAFHARLDKSLRRQYPKARWQHIYYGPANKFHIDLTQK